MKIKSWLPYVISAIIIIILIAQFYPSSNDESASLDDSTNVNYGKLDEVIFDVKTEKVKKNDLLLYINANGLVRAKQELEITSNISGIIKELNIAEGSKVSKNQLLLSFDEREYELALDDSKIKVTAARVEYGLLSNEPVVDSASTPQSLEIQKQIDDLEKDYSAGRIDEKKYNELRDVLDMKLIFSGAKREEIILNKSGLTTAINSYKRAKLNYEYTKITAPFNGIIGDFDLAAGQRISAGQKLFKIFNTSELIVDVGVLENDVAKISKGSIVKISTPALKGEFNGRVIRISPYINQDTKTCKVTIEIVNPSQMLKPGMFVNVMIEVENLTNRILIPKEALLVRDKRELVFVVEEGLAKWKYIQTGEQNDKYIEIKKGVEPGEDIIVEGQYTLAHDAKVKVIK